MDDLQLLSALIDLAEQMGVHVRQSPGGGRDHPGGALVRLKDREMLFLDPSAPVPDQISAAVNALKSKPELQDMFIAPEIRERLDA